MAAASPAATLCAALLGLFVVTAWLGVRDKSATFDEPVGAVGAWTNLKLRDYRLDFEHPPLWKYWAALPNGGRPVGADFSDESWDAMLRDPHAKVRRACVRQSLAGDDARDWRGARRCGLVVGVARVGSGGGGGRDRGVRAGSELPRPRAAREERRRRGAARDGGGDGRVAIGAAGDDRARGGAVSAVRRGGDDEVFGAAHRANRRAALPVR